MTSGGTTKPVSFGFLVDIGRCHDSCQSSMEKKSLLVQCRNRNCSQLIRGISNIPYTNEKINRERELVPKTLNPECSI